MGKKILILIFILAVVGVATIPLWTSRMADKAFENLNRNSPEIIKQSLLVKMRMGDYKSGRVLAEKAILYFQESKELPYFVYNAAICGEQQGKPYVAIYWYNHFVKRFPKHEWNTQAEKKLKTLEGMHGTE